MSGAERSYRIALYAFPKQYREERGEEVVATILEGGDSWRPRLREFFGLFWAGIGQRALRAGGEKAVGSVRAGIRLGAYFLLWVVAAAGVNQVLDPVRANNGSVAGGRYEIIGIAVTSLLALAALSRGWWAAPLGFTVAWSIADSLFLDSNAPHWPWRPDSLGLGYWMLFFSALGFLPPLLCVIARPRGREPHDLRSPLWAIAGLALGALMAWHTTSWLEWQWLLAVPPVAWLVLGWRDLRLAIATATVMTFAGLELVFYAGPIAWDAPTGLVGYALVIGAAALAAIGFGARRANA